MSHDLRGQSTVQTAREITELAAELFNDSQRMCVSKQFSVIEYVALSSCISLYICNLHISFIRVNCQIRILKITAKLEYSCQDNFLKE